MSHQRLRHWRSASINKGEDFGRSNEELACPELPLAVGIADIAPGIGPNSDDPADRYTQCSPSFAAWAQAMLDEKSLDSIGGPCRGNHRRKDPTNAVRPYGCPSSGHQNLPLGANRHNSIFGSLRWQRTHWRTHISSGPPEAPKYPRAPF